MVRTVLRLGGHRTCRVDSSGLLVDRQALRSLLRHYYRSKVRDRIHRTTRPLGSLVRRIAPVCLAQHDPIELPIRLARSLPLIAWRPLPGRTCFGAAGLRNTGHRAAASTPAWPQCPRQTRRPSPAYTTFLPTSAGGCDEPLPLLPLTAHRAEHRNLGRLNR